MVGRFLGTGAGAEGVKILLRAQNLLSSSSLKEISQRPSSTVDFIEALPISGPEGESSHLSPSPKKSPNLLHSQLHRSSSDKLSPICHEGYSMSEGKGNKEIGIQYKRSCQGFACNGVHLHSYWFHTHCSMDSCLGSLYSINNPPPHLVFFSFSFISFSPLYIRI